MQLCAKNYRCFSDEVALRLDLDYGFTALLGPNNAGKSAALRLFYELRPLFTHVRHISHLGNLAARNPVGVSFHGVEDQLEVFHNGNDRPLTIELGFNPTDTNPHLARVTLSCTRHAPNTWHGQLFAGQPDMPIVGIMSVGGVDYLRRADGAQIPFPQDKFDLLADMTERSLYVGAFRNAISEGSGTYFDLQIGTSFIQLWDDWKTGTTRASNEAAIRLTRDLSHIFGYDTLEINPTRDGSSIQVVADHRPYRLREIGAGFAQFLVVLANIVIRKPRFLLIDEPELNLHPRLQADFLTTLASHCPAGVMFATHSLGLARTSADLLYGFRREGERSVCRPFEQLSNFAAFAGEMGFSGYHDLGLNTILLVEGVTEVKAVQQLLRVLNKDHDVVVLPLGGRQLIRAGVEAELAELRRLSNNVAVLIDSERTTAGASLEESRQAFLDACIHLGFKVKALDRRAFENYLPDAAVKAALGGRYRALGPYEKLSDCSPAWAKQDNWRVCRLVPGSVLRATDLGQFLQDI